jgi:hypothetical protein
MRAVRAGIVATVVAALFVPPFVSPARAGTRCRPTRPHELVIGFQPVVGEGPVYATLFRSDAVVFGLPGEPWGAAKVLWIGEPGYEGKVVIRGRRIDAAGMVRFGGAGRFQTRLRLSTDEYAHGSWAGSAAGWRDWPSTVRVQRNGCYELTVKTSRGVDHIVFRAQRR